MLRKVEKWPDYQERSTKRSCRDRSQSKPPQNTRLGGDIFIHGGGTGKLLGLIRDWTLGCVALENENIKELFDLLPVKTPVTRSFRTKSIWHVLARGIDNPHVDRMLAAPVGPHTLRQICEHTTHQILGAGEGFRAAARLSRALPDWWFLTLLLLVKRGAHREYGPAVLDAGYARVVKLPPSRVRSTS